MVLRRNHDDKNAKEYSFLRGKSTDNERIEKRWRELINSTLDFYRKLFKSMKKKRTLNTADMLHVELLKSCFSPVLKLDLEHAAKKWDKHRLCKQKNVKSPNGIPNIMYYWPEKYGAKEYKKPYNLVEVERLLVTKTIQPQLYNKRAKIFMTILMPDVPPPESAEEAFNMFYNAVELIKLKENEIEC